MVVGFTTTYAISTYHQWSCVFEPRPLRGVLDTTVCDKVWQWLATGRWFSPSTPVSCTNKTDRYNITEILLNVALSTINQPTNQSSTIDGDYEIQVIEKIQKTGAFDFNFVNVNSYKIIWFEMFMMLLSFFFHLFHHYEEIGLCFFYCFLFADVIVFFSTIHKIV